jgi:hypothetical protein
MVVEAALPAEVVVARSVAAEAAATPAVAAGVTQAAEDTRVAGVVVTQADAVDHKLT